MPSEEGVVPDTRPCLNCGYSLAGLQESGTCPECGALIARSLHGDLLRYAEPGYVAMLQRGVLVAELGLCVALGAVVVGVAAELGLEIWYATRPGPSPHVAQPIISAGVGAGAIATMVGWWLLTTPDPAGRDEDRGASVRRGLRGALLVAGAATVVLAASGLRGGIGGVLLSLVAILAWASMFLFSMQYLRRLAPRIPDQKVFAQADRMMWLLPVLMTAGWLVVVGPVIGLVLYLGLLDRVRQGLSGARLERRYEDWPSQSGS